MTENVNESENEPEKEEYKPRWEDDKTTMAIPIELKTSQKKGKGLAHYKLIEREAYYSVVQRMIKFVEKHGGKKALNSEIE